LILLTTTGCLPLGLTKQHAVTRTTRKVQAHKPSHDMDTRGDHVQAVGYEVAAPLPDEKPPVSPPEPEQSADWSGSPLRLADSLQLAFRQNPHIRVMGFVPAAIATRTTTEEAQFDPVFSAGGQFVQAEQQVGSVIQAQGTGLNSISTTGFATAPNSPNQLGIQKRWTSGTIARMGYNTNYNYNSPAGQFLIVNPAYNSALGLSVEQPLFQGRGSDKNMLGIKIAQANHNQSQAEFQSEVNKIIFQVQAAYWQLWLADVVVKSYEEIVSQAERTWKKEQRRLELGDGSLTEVAQALENYESLRVDLEQARQAKQAAETALKQFLGLDPRDGQTFDLADEPVEDEFVPNLDSGSSLARSTRPELAAAREMIRAAELDLQRQRDGLSPNLSAIAGYSLTGLGSGLGNSIGNVVSTDYGSMTLGLVYQRAWGQRAANAAVQQAELVVGQKRAALKELEAGIGFEVRQASDQIKTSYGVFERQRSRLDASRTQFETLKRLYEEGQVDLDRYVRAQTAYANARRDERAAAIDYNLALNQWNRAIGFTAVGGRADQSSNGVRQPGDEVPRMPPADDSLTSEPETKEQPPREQPRRPTLEAIRDGVPSPRTSRRHAPANRD
jgi:outer membrane protein TolC